MSSKPFNQKDYSEGGRLLPMWVVYDHPRDYPGVFVARLWIIYPMQVRTNHMRTARTLEELRALVPFQSDTWLPRRPNDDPCILGSWI